jgi:MFS transporter, ACS family, hexuronate transporter
MPSVPSLPPLPRSMAWAVALVATLTMAVSYMDRTALAVLAPTVTKAMGISEPAYGLLASAFSMAYLLGTPLSGWWIDRIGARRGLVYSVLTWSAVAALHALAPGFAFLFALRIALGLAEGPSFPGAAQTVMRVLPPEDRSRGFGVLFTGSSVGAMLAPPLASYLYRLAGWRVAFLGTAAIGLLWIPMWVAVTMRPAVARQLDTPGPVIEATPRPPLHALVSHPIMVRALLAIFAVAPVTGFVVVWGSKLLVRHFGLAQGDVGSYLWLPPLCSDVGAVLFGDLAARQRRAAGAPPRALFVATVALSGGLALLPLAGTPWESVAILGVAMAGVIATYTLVTSDMLGRMPAGSASSAAGIIAGAQSLALIISSPLIGMAVEHYGNYDVIALALGAWVVPGSVIWWVWRPAPRFEAS